MVYAIYLSSTSSMAFASALSRLNLLSKPALPYHRSLKPLTSGWLSRSSSASSSFAAHRSTTTNSASATSRTLAPSPRENLVILGIETSCDDTAAAIVRLSVPLLFVVVFPLTNWWFSLISWFRCRSEATVKFSAKSCLLRYAHVPL